MTESIPTRDELATRYIEQLPYEPYPLQEEAILAWFTGQQGVLVCAPTGMGKTLIAEAALFEALHTGRVAYYTTPLIALTEQKFREMQAAAVRWGFQPTDVGLVTGNRRENPEARVLVVVAEILLNRLLHTAAAPGDCPNFREPAQRAAENGTVPFSRTAAFDFSDVSAVVMDEFHSFSDPERGIVWELSLGLLPPEVRLLLLSATVGNAPEFLQWLQLSHQRKLDLVKSEERRVPLSYQWVGDQLLVEHIEELAAGDAQTRKTPALVFCFNREECWTIAEQIKGKRVLTGDQQARVLEALKRYDLSTGAGPKLRQLLQRGVGVHHAGLLPKHRRIVEELFQEKLLSVALCTETLSAGINLPARSVVVPNIMKGPPGKKRIIDPSSAHQMFGRAGRPQFDTQGYVYVLAHEDDVKIARWREKFDQIPDDTKDPGLLRAKKDLKRKMPKRRENEQYWTEAQFEKLRIAPPGRLVSRGPLPWRLLAHMLDASPEVDLVRRLVSKRLLDSSRVEASQRDLDKMLLVLWRGGFVELEPAPPKDDAPPPPPPVEKPKKSGLMDLILAELRPDLVKEAPPPPPPYQARLARATPDLQKLLLFRSVNPLYGVFLVNQLGIANRQERIQALESVLDLPRSIGHFVRVPKQHELPPGPLATTRLDPLLLQLGLATAEELVEGPPGDGSRPRVYDEERKWVLTLSEKLRRLFDYDFPGVHSLYMHPAWAAGEILELGGRFETYVTSKGLQKQEGIIFRHLLRMILLVAEFQQLAPPDVPAEEWRADLADISAALAECCRTVDPSSTDKALEEAAGAETGDDDPE